MLENLPAGEHRRTLDGLEGDRVRDTPQVVMKAGRERVEQSWVLLWVVCPLGII